MKKMIKGIIVPVLLAIIIGFILGKYVFNNYKDNLYHELSSSKLYLLQSGEYDSIESMREANNKGSYVYFKDNNKYKTVVGITKNYDSIDKIKELYSDNLLVKECYVPNGVLKSKQDEYEILLRKTNDIREVREAVDNILNLYRGGDNIKLIMVN